MAFAYMLNSSQILEEVVKWPWLRFPAPLSEILVVCDDDDHPRELRAFVERPDGKLLLDKTAMSIDAALALIRAAKRNGIRVDLRTELERQIEAMIELCEKALHTDDASVDVTTELEECYRKLRSQLVERMLARIGSAEDLTSARLQEIVKKHIPERLSEVEDRHKPHFEQFVTWHYVAILKDLSGCDHQKTPFPCQGPTVDAS